MQSTISRRGFLKFCSLGLAGLMMPANFVTTTGTPLRHTTGALLLGRVAEGGYLLYEAPTIESAIVKEMEMDSLYEITGVTVSEDDVSRNRIWYQLDKKGYAHSRRIQPVRRRVNQVDTTIPETGCLGEITIPFVDAYSNIEAGRSIVYRLYYATTFWVRKRITDQEGIVWYQLLDDYYYNNFYVPAYSLRLVPELELTAISPEIPPDEKKIVIDLPTQSLTAYEKDKVVFMARISSGVRLQEGGFATQTGFYRTTHKRPCRHMVTPASEFGSGFDLPGVPWVSYFTSDGVALHGSYWHNDFGVPHSHGCINMAPQAAKWVYRWSNPTVPADRYHYSDIHGTRLIIQ